MSRPATRNTFVMTLVAFACLFLALAVAGCGLPAATTASLIPINDNTAEDQPDPGTDPLDPAPTDPDDPDPPTDTDPNAPPPDDHDPAEDPPPPPDDDPDDDTPADDSPLNDYCAAVADWDAAWIVFELEVLDLVNQHRAAGADCGSAGSFEPAGPLHMNDALRCAARNHSLDMAVRDYFDHYSPEGDGPGVRLDLAGYTGSSWAENIAWGYTSPAAVVAGWMNSPGHCANIMRPHLTETGVGYYDGRLWTQTFGRP